MSESPVSLTPFQVGKGERRACILTDGVAAPDWLLADSALLCALMAGAIFTRFWRLAWPPTPVFDEVIMVGQAHDFLNSIPVFDYHPPLATHLIALGIWLLGDVPWGWRVANAACGSALVGITFLVGRRMFGSRLAGALAALFVLCDGLFLVDSRFAIMEIFHITFAAWAFLMLFRYSQQSNPISQRRALVWLGVSLGLCLGSKFLIPMVTATLVAGFLIFDIAGRQSETGSFPRRLTSATMAPAAAALALVGGISAFIYLCIFFPNYWFGWWQGLGDYFAFAGWSVTVNRALPTTSNLSSPMWTWPLMLRPLVYWNHKFFEPDRLLILGLGNPVVWWGIVLSMVIFAAQALTTRSVPRTFLLIAYIVYLAMWLPIFRFKFLYHYMSSVYVGFLAVGAVVAECWQGRARRWEQIGLMICVLPALVLGLRMLAPVAAVAIGAGYALSLRRGALYAGRFAAATFICAAILLFVYLFPIETGQIVPLAELQRRLWWYAPGLERWLR